MCTAGSAARVLSQYLQQTTSIACCIIIAPATSACMLSQPLLLPLLFAYKHMPDRASVAVCRTRCKLQWSLNVMREDLQMKIPGHPSQLT
jgi:hypothetical protein